MTIEAEVSVPTPGVQIEPNSHRPWGEKWCAALRALAALEEAYATRLDSAETEDRAKRVFNELNDMRDWLLGDTPPSVHASDITDYYDNEPRLEVTEAVANTYKHHTRTKKNVPTAKIGKIVFPPGATAGALVTIAVTYPTGSSRADRAEDALASALEAVAAWRDFFKKHNIDEPSC